MFVDMFSLYMFVSLLLFGYGGLKIFSIYNGFKKNRDVVYMVYICLQFKCYELFFCYMMKVREVVYKNCSGRFGWVLKNDYF